MKKFEMPDMHIIEFAKENIVTASVASVQNVEADFKGAKGTFSDLWSEITN